MQDSFATQDEIWSKCSVDATLLGLLGSPVGDEQLNNKLRREEQSPDVITEADIDFISLYYIDGIQTKNHLANKGVLQVDFFCATRYSGTRLVTQFKKIMKANWQDYKLAYEGQSPSGVVGVYKYRLRYITLIEG